MASRAKKIAEKSAPSSRKFSSPGRSGIPSSSRRPKAPKGESPSIWDQLLLWAGKCEGLPPDLAENHDHYLHGRPRK